MKIKEYLKASEVTETYSTNGTSVAAISEVLPVVDESKLRNLVFAGIGTKQIEIKNGTAKLSKKAIPIYVGELIAAVGESIIITPDINPRELNKSLLFIDKTIPSVAEYLRELKAATDAINKKYSEVGGLLGNPVTEVEFGGKDYEIPYRKYQRGAIYVTPHGTHEVHGAIYQKYLALGALAGFLGFPETDELSTTLGTGKFNHFHGGSIYWSPQTGAWSIHGKMRDKWWQMDAERGYLGFPVSDVEQDSVSFVSFFQRGSLILTAGSFQDLPDSVMFTKKLENAFAQCSTDFGMNSRGEWYSRGHLHGKSALGSVTTVVTSSRFADSGGRVFVTPPVERSLGGEFDTEDRNDDWNQMGSDDFIRENWDFIRNAGTTTVMHSNTSISDVMSLALAPFVAIGIAVIAIVGVAFLSSKKWCGPVPFQRRDPNGDTTSGLTWVLGEPNEPCPPGYQ